jgi:hypothetical protein
MKEPIPALRLYKFIACAETPLHFFWVTFRKSPYHYVNLASFVTKCVAKVTLYVHEILPYFSRFSSDIDEILYRKCSKHVRVCVAVSAN